MKAKLNFSLFSVLLILLLASCSTPNSYVSGTPVGLGQIIRDYSNNQYGVWFTIATNQPSSEISKLGAPTTWAKDILYKIPGNEGITNGTITLKNKLPGASRYWSTRYADYAESQPFDKLQTDKIFLELSVTLANKVSMQLIKQEANGSLTTFPVEIYGYLTGAQGHLIYGKYGGFNGLITISLWKGSGTVG